jgi:hypothetical protein
MTSFLMILLILITVSGVQKIHTKRFFAFYFDQSDEERRRLHSWHYVIAKVGQMRCLSTGIGWESTSYNIDCPSGADGFGIVM